MRFVRASDRSLLINFGSDSADKFSQGILRLFRAIRRLHDPRIRNLHPAYASLLIDYDPLKLGAKELEKLVQQADEDSGSEEITGTVVEIPVFYGEETGPDLELVAQHCALSTEEVIRLHSQAQYRVAFLGFSPGFAYLSGLPDQLRTPRKSTPRRIVPAGSVAIAGSQAGVYPLNSPGGWQVIGRTPLTMFNPKSEEPTRLLVGDTVRFLPIGKAELDGLEKMERTR